MKMFLQYVYLLVFVFILRPIVALIMRYISFLLFNNFLFIYFSNTQFLYWVCGDYNCEYCDLHTYRATPNSYCVSMYTCSWPLFPFLSLPFPLPE